VQLQTGATETNSQPEPIGRLESALRSSARLGEERSLVDLVLLACDFSDDPTEIGELVDALVTEASSRLVGAERVRMPVRGALESHRQRPTRRPQVRCGAPR